MWSFLRPAFAASAAFLIIAIGGSHPALAAAGEDELRPGAPFDAVPFGFKLPGEDARAYGCRWAQPRKVRRVLVELDPASPPPNPDKVHLQYWHGGWKGTPEPVASEQGAGHVGWQHMDDWTNGRWKDADARLDVQGPRWTFTFAPTGATEFKLNGPGVSYRKTLKIRLRSDQPIPRPVKFRAITDAVYQPLTARILFGKPACPQIRIADTETGYAEGFNAAIVAVRPIRDAQVTGQSQRQWTLPAGGDSGIEVDILMAVDRVDPQFDRPIVTIRSKDRPFSFAVDEVARGDRILLDDLGVLVVRGGDAIGLQACRDLRRESAARTVYHRVQYEREQTLSRAWNDMPLKWPLYFVHGLPGDRNVFRQDSNGEVTLVTNKRWFDLPPSPKDTQRKHWQGRDIKFGWRLPAGYRFARRELKDGYLPLLTTWYQDGRLLYEQSTILDKLDGNLAAVALDDPTILLVRIRAINTDKAREHTASLLLAAGPREGTDQLTRKGGRVFAVWEGKPRLRYVCKGLEKGTVVPEGDGLRWRLALKPGQSHELVFAIPSITLDKEEEIAPLERRSFEADAARICSFWRDLTARGASIETPEPWLNDFYRAHVRHLLVNCYKEIGSDRLHAHVGTFSYGVFPDESVMMISDLDRRGYHDEARCNYDSLLHYQGTVQMPGNYKSTEGLLYGDGGHDMGGYNKSHGWAMWGLAEHWWYTRDREWMSRVAPKLVAACDWVTRERKATMVEDPDGKRPLEYGFLPTGSLEDVTDYWYWMVTNVCAVWGCRALAEALQDFGHPEAPRLLADAKAFHDDVMRGTEEARIISPVVRLRDGTYVPHYPSRLYERGRCHGWLRETLEGAIHLIITGMIDPNSPQARWILDDFEDNLYISDRYGYAIPSFDDFWFSRGGFSMQANLLGGPLCYLYRDEVKHFLRAYFNSFASAYYPDVRMCNEHSLPELGHPKGDHFKSSDEAQSAYWLRLMFVNEYRGDLYLGQAIPRYWLAGERAVAIERAASHFGEVSLRIEPRPAAEEIRADLTLTDRPPRPGQVFLRLRHPKGRRIQSATVNGQTCQRFDPEKEWVVLPGSTTGRVEVVTRY